VVVTDMLKETMHISDDEARARFDSVIPLGRTGEPADCAAAAAFFASPAANWITGQFLDVAGGQPT
jgi:NAD(P)-dependent dehydrogenase (short-subunit alcohol dehydrogenase family)